jgi:hypothetical protein
MDQIGHILMAHRRRKTNNMIETFGTRPWERLNRSSGTQTGQSIDERIVRLINQKYLTEFLRTEAYK